MGRSRGLLIDQGQGCYSVYLKKYCLSFQHPQINRIRQRPPIRQPGLSKLLPGIEKKYIYSTPWYPQSNGLAEAFNKTLLTALKKRLDSSKGKFMDELPRVLWAYRTTARRSTDISPFVVIYRMEAIIPIEIGMPTIRSYMPEQENTELVIKDMNTVDEL